MTRTRNMMDLHDRTRRAPVSRAPREHIEHTLEPIAGKAGFLAEAVNQLALVTPKADSMSLAQRREKLESMLAETGVIDKIVGVTGLRPTEVVDHVLDQLVRVAGFAMAGGEDQDSIDQNLSTVESLIRDGRGHLFSPRR